MAPFTPLPEPALEAGLLAAEAALEVTITVRDLTGWLRGPDGVSLIDPERNGHQRQEVCARGFTPACVVHCRHATNASLREHPVPQSTCCWKGVREVLVPVIRSGSLHGYLFAGAWRGPGPAPSGSWAPAWRRLPRWDDRRAAAVTAALSLLADGLWAAAERLRLAPEPTDRAGRIRAFIRQRLAQGIGRVGMARHLGLSPSRTSHAVREACGASLQAVIAQERLAAAQRLLSEGVDPVATVGAQVGWADPPHFARSFRRLTGLSPGAWRARHRIA